MSISVACSTVVSLLVVGLFVSVGVLGLVDLVFGNKVVAFVVFVVLSMLLLTFLFDQELSLYQLSLLYPSFFSRLRLFRTILLLLLCDIFGLLFLLFVLPCLFFLSLPFLLIAIVNSFIFGLLNDIRLIILSVGLMHFMNILNML